MTKNKREKSILHIKSYQFAIRIVNLSKSLNSEQKEWILSKQILRSGTAVGALVRESEFGQSNLDFIHKLSIALKEANETDYWLNILKDTSYIDEKMYESLNSDCNELISILIASIKTVKNKINN